MATLNKSNTYLTDLINSGTDAMSNLYYVQFSGNAITGKSGLNLDNDQIQQWGVRCKGFTPPAPTHNTTSNDFMTETLDVPTTSFDITKEFSLTFRLDSNYKLYKQLLSLQCRTVNELTSVATTDVDNGFNVDVYIPASDFADSEVNVFGSDNTKWRKLYSFSYCWIYKITPPSFDWNSNDAQTIEASIKFYDWEGPLFKEGK